MLDVIVAGGMGAVVNYALFTHWFSSGIMILMETLLKELGVVIQMGAAINTLFSVLFCLFGGTLFMIVWRFLKARMIRFLLSTNVWFLTPKHPLSKIWYMLMLALLGSKNRGAGNYQEYLPSLPVPKLKNTLKKYLDTVRPLLTEEEYKKTQTAVAEFQSSGAGSKLQRWLLLRSWWVRNWMADWWLDFIYLRQRTPIPFNSNYYALGSRAVTTPHGLDRSATQIYNTAVYMCKEKQGKVENFMGGKTAPFCTEGNKYLAFSARIPGEEIDKLVSYKNENPRHVVVVRRGKFFQFDAITKNGHPVSPKVIRAQLERIVELAGDDEDESCVAACTALPRTKWAQVRKRLEENPANKRILKLIDSSLTYVNLQSDSVDSTNLTEVARMLFHGNINNRWFDKSVQLIACLNGTVGANVEHAPLDATLCGQMWEYLLCAERYDEQGRVVDVPNKGSGSETVEVQELKWELEGFQDDLAEARENLQGMIADSDLIVVTPSYGKRIPKKCGLSPDGWFQMAMQLAYYRLNKKFVLTYESATTRLYYKGRTETIRPVSDDSVAFVKSFDDPSVPRDDVKKLLKNAIETQCKYKMEAMRGLGVDRHLFGLYVVAKGLKLDPMPKLFTDKAFNFSFTLSTSQTPVRFTNQWKVENSSYCGGFGTVSDDGYGVSYMVINEDEVNFSIHSKRSCPDTDSKMFGDALVKAFDDLRGLYNV